MIIQDQNVHEALQWIVGVLDRLQIPYQIAGGLAARCYGATRQLHDIDIYVPTESIQKLEQELSDYIEVGPAHHKDEHWDIVFMKLSYHGQQIEFGDADRTQYFDSETQQWIKEKIDFLESVVMEYEGIDLAVMPKQQLIDYKRRLNREVDRIDIKEILP